jgi:hypothetical protein
MGTNQSSTKTILTSSEGGNPNDLITFHKAPPLKRSTTSISPHCQHTKF